MTRTYNGLNNPSNLLTFSEVPNILEVRDGDGGGTRATINVVLVNSSQNPSGNGEYSITILDETVTNTLQYKDAKNRFFYYSGSDRLKTAYSLCRALNSCASLVADWDIRVDETTANITRIIMTARNAGHRGITTADTTANFSAVTFGVTDGSSYSSLEGGQVFCDIFEDGEYVTTLSKNLYNGVTDFDVSPVLSTFSDFGQTTPYRVHAYAIDPSGQYHAIGDESGYTTAGYHANDSDYYLYLGSGTRLLRNDNNIGGIGTVYGVYDLTSIPFSILVGAGSAGFSYTVACYNSIGEVLSSWTETSQYTYGSRIKDFTASVPAAIMNNVYRIGITVGSMQELSFKVIKPLRMADRFIRVYWRNEYGGLSFFDFTGGVDEAEDIDTDTYTPTVYDLYTREAHYGEKDYRRTVTKSVTVTTHLMTLGEKYPLESLARSMRAWIRENGTDHLISVTGLDIKRDTAYDDTYRATVTFKPTENV